MGKKRKRKRAKQGTAAAIKVVEQKAGHRSPRALFSDREAVLGRVAMVSPVFVAAVVFGGISEFSLLLFIPFTLICIVAAFYDLFLVRARQGLARGVGLSGVLLLVISSVAFCYDLTHDLWSTSALLLLLVLSLLQTQLGIQKPISLIAALCYPLVFSSLAAVLGAYSQLAVQLHNEEAFLVETFVFGFVPGTFLAAAIVARFSRVLEEAGWTRSFNVEKKGQIVARPGGVARLFSLLLVLGPSVTVLLSLRTIPQTFLLSVLVLLPTSSVATSFFQATATNRQIARRTIWLALFATGVMLGVGLTLRL